MWSAVSHLAQAWSALLASLPCAQYSVFLAAILFVQPWDHSFTPIPLPFILPLLNQCDRCLVPLAWGLMAEGRRFASHGGATLSRGSLCQGGSPWTSRAPTSTSEAVVNEVKIIKSNHNGIVSLFHPLYRA